MKIAEVLVRRDGITKEEAEERVQEVRTMIHEELEYGGDYDSIEDIMATELGLEMDYIMELL